MIPKPDIPEDIALNYKLVKVQWTEQLVSIQKQKTERIKKETEKIKVVIAFKILKWLLIPSRLCLMPRKIERCYKLI